VFPHDLDDGQSLDDHFEANKTVVLMLTVLANSLVCAVMVVATFGRENAMLLAINYMGALMVYALLVVPAAFTRSRRVFAWLVGIHIAIYLCSAVVTAAFPDLMGQMGYAETPAAEAGAR